MNIFFMLAVAAILPLLGMSSTRRIPNLTTELEYTFSEFSHQCSPPLLKYLEKKVAKNRAFANFSNDEIRLLLGSRFAKISVRNPVVQRAFSEFIDPSASLDAIHAWLSSNPLLGPNERRFLIVALLIYEREASADLATISMTLSRAQEEFGKAEPEAIAAIGDEFKRLTNEWEFVSLLLANVIGFPRDFDQNMRLMASELYRDRVGNIEIALLSKDWSEAHKIILSALKNNIVMQENEALIQLVQKLKSMDMSMIDSEEISTIKDLANKVLLDTRDAIAQQIIPKLMESDAADQLGDAAKKRLAIRLRGAYRGHYFEDADLNTLKLQFLDEKIMRLTLAKPSFDEKDRARIRLYLLRLLKRARTVKMREKIILLIFRLYAPPTLRTANQQPALR